MPSDPVRIVEPIDPSTGSMLVAISGLGAALSALATAAKQDTGNASLASILAALSLSKGSGNVDVTTLRAILAADGPLNTVMGTTADAAIKTDATGTVSAKLRGLISLFLDGLKTLDAGPSWTVVRTYTPSADMTTAAAITAAPTSGQKIVADDILISVDTAMLFTVQMESTANVLAGVYLPANGTVQLTLRDLIKGDAADKKLYGKASVAGNVKVTVCYHSEA